MPNPNKKEARVGFENTTPRGEHFTVIDYESCKKCTVKFTKTGSVVKATWKNAIEGSVKDKNAPSVSGMGYIGEGEFSTTSHPEIHNKWTNILYRAYSKNQRDKYYRYGDVTVAEEWHNFQTFAAWAISQKGSTIPQWNIDKDVLVKGSRIYSPSTSCFIPTTINNLFTMRKVDRGDYPLGVNWNNSKGGFVAQCNVEGKRKWLGLYKTKEEAFAAYKVAKETEIQRIANEWKDQIEPNVYQALMAYQVEITD